MDQIKEKNIPTKKKSDHSNIRISNKTKNELQKLLDKINKKDFGKKITSDEIISYAISKLTNDDISLIQDDSLSNEDKFEMKFQEFKANPKSSRQDFLGGILDKI